MNVQLYGETVHLFKQRASRYLKSMTELCNDFINIHGKVNLPFLFFLEQCIIPESEYESVGNLCQSNPWRRR